MTRSIIATLFLLLATGLAPAATDVFAEIDKNAPAVDDTFVEIDRKAP